MPLATVSDPRGLKRICLSCSSRFYDLNKRPIVCPNCDTEFTGEVKIKARRGRMAANDAVDAVDDTEEEDAVVTAEAEDEEDADTEETVSLEEVDGEDDIDEDDLDIDSDLDDDLDDEDDLDDDDLDVDLDEDDK